MHVLMHIQLLKNRIEKASTGEDNPFQYTINGESRPIPPELLCEAVVSDVVSDECEVDGIRPHLSIEAYREARKPFEYEGIPPFFRNKMVSSSFLCNEGVLT